MSPLLAVIHWEILATVANVIVIGAVAVYLLLPRPKPFPWWWGALLATYAVMFAVPTLLGTGVVSAETFLFYAFSLIAVVSGGLLVTQHNPARAALAFTLVILSTCGLFLLLAAPFLAAATIIIYAGAIIVTFLFVLMLAQQAGLGDADARSREPLLASITGFVLLGALVYVLQLTYEKNETVQIIDQMLVRTRAAKGSANGLNPGEFQKLLTTIQEPLTDASKRLEEKNGTLPDELRMLLVEFESANTSKNTEATKTLEHLEERLLQTRQSHGWVRPPHEAKMSDMSGPSANESPTDLRYDTQGRPQMPADNAAYLGRSLFTDYLLPVELGGFLLLVAVVGSIAIAHRRTTTTSERPA